MKKNTAAWDRLWGAYCLGLSCTLIPGLAGAEEVSATLSSGQVQAQTGLTELSLEALMDIQVTSVSKSPQKLSESAAAIFVITQEDIRRSGMNSIPELLRMVPGLDVAQIDGNVWAIGSRGFNHRLTNKLLVLIDGRSVYTPTSAGVNWDVQNPVLEDVERIEVIRGPGGTLWGANAVNGVINIITKNAKDTQGGLVTAGAGSIGQSDGVVRYGAKLGDSSYFRIYGQGSRRGNFPDATGADGHDAWNGKQGGFRVDATPSAVDTIMLQGNFYEVNSDIRLIHTTLTPPSTILEDNTDRNRGGHLLMHWQRRLSDDSDMSLQAYYDRADRWRTVAEDESVETYDLDFQHRFRLTPSQKLIWGLGYRSVESQFQNVFSVSFLPAHRRTELFSAFAQDEIALLENLQLTAGSKFEHNSFTGFEYQPNLRLAWEPWRKQTLWAAVSRAVRMPALIDTDLRVYLVAAPGTPPNLIALQGNPDFKSEVLTAYEMGYRGEVSRHLTLDVAGFYNRYRNLGTQEPGIPTFEADPAPPHLLIPLRFGNSMSGDTCGLEFAAKWQVTDKWRLSPAYTWFKARAHLDPTSGDTTSQAAIEGGSPSHQVQILSRLDLPNRFELDASLYYVGKLADLGVPAYTRLDVRLGWRPRKDMELSLMGQNLTDKRHAEFPLDSSGIRGGEVPRSVYGKITLRF